MPMDDETPPDRPPLSLHADNRRVAELLTNHVLSVSASLELLRSLVHDVYDAGSAIDRNLCNLIGQWFEERAAKDRDTVKALIDELAQLLAKKEGP